MLAPASGLVGDRVRPAQLNRARVECLHTRAARRLERRLVLIELMIAEPTHRTLHRRIIALAHIQQTRQPPRRLARRARPLAHQRAIQIRVCTLAETAIRILHAPDPRDRSRHRGMIFRQPRVRQPAQRLPRSIHIVAAPSSPPASFRFLLGQQIAHRFEHRRMLGRHAAGDERLDRPPRDIRARRILHRVVVRERNMLHPLPVRRLVERRPAAVVVLHGDDPAERLPRRLAVDALTTPIAGPHQRLGHHSGVVHIRVPVVVILKRPRRGLISQPNMPILGAQVPHPIPGHAHLPRDQPVANAREFGVVRRRNSRLGERVHRNPGVPHRAETRLQAHMVQPRVRVRLREHKLIQVALRLHQHRMIACVTKRLERDLQIDHRREDRSEPLGGLRAHAIQNPRLRQLERLCPHRRELQSLHRFEHLVCEEK